MSSKKFFFASLIFLSMTLFAGSLSAENYSSSNFSVESPVIFSGGYSTSTGFTLSGVISQMAIGSSTSATNKLFGGFLYFPFVSTPAVVATAGNAEVALSWTSADASTGWAVGGYSVGQATVSGGPYSFSDVGNVLTSNRTGLTNGTPYYFVIRVIDALGNPIATSTQVSGTPVAPATPPSPGGSGGSGGGGGGGGGGSTPSTGATGINFSGRAYPKSVVTFLKDAQVVTSTVSDAEANFKVSLTGLTPGNYFFSVYSEDNAGMRSNPITFPVSLTEGVMSNIGGIFITPTIAVDKSQVKKGDDIAIFGQTTKKSEVTIQVNSAEPYFAKTNSDTTGIYLYNFDTSVLELGDHSTKSKTSIAGEISSYSQTASFVVGLTNILTALSPKTCEKKGDVNHDCKVSLVDFSVVAYWYKKSNPPANVDVNGDKKIDLVDFSIMAFNWTG